MFRRPPTKDGKPLDLENLHFDNSLRKPFKPPTPSVKRPERALPPRKRKRVSYKENRDDSDSDDDKAKKKKKSKTKDGDYGSDGDIPTVKKFPVYKATPLGQTAKRFSIPTMTNAAGEVVPTVMSKASLGIRPPVQIIPRPLHNPMDDHAIVLYDPTIDDRETDEDKQERLKLEAKEKLEKENAASAVGMYNPHKSLKALLGEDEKSKQRLAKVPVVIDPRLTKVLRPHQVEGVKVCFRF